MGSSPICLVYLSDYVNSHHLLVKGFYGRQAASLLITTRRVVIKENFNFGPDAHFIGPPGLSYKISNNLFIAYLVQRKNRVLLIPKSRIETWGE